MVIYILPPSFFFLSFCCCLLFDSRGEELSFLPSTLPAYNKTMNVPLLHCTFRRGKIAKKISKRQPYRTNLKNEALPIVSLSGYFLPSNSHPLPPTPFSGREHSCAYPSIKKSRRKLAPREGPVLGELRLY